MEFFENQHKVTLQMGFYKNQHRVALDGNQTVNGLNQLIKIFQLLEYQI